MFKQFMSSFTRIFMGREISTPERSTRKFEVIKIIATSDAGDFEVGATLYAARKDWLDSFDSLSVYRFHSDIGVKDSASIAPKAWFDASQNESSYGLVFQDFIIPSPEESERLGRVVGQAELIAQTTIINGLRFYQARSCLASIANQIGMEPYQDQYRLSTSNGYRIFRMIVDR